MLSGLANGTERLLGGILCGTCTCMCKRVQHIYIVLLYICISLQSFLPHCVFTQGMCSIYDVHVKKTILTSSALDPSTSARARFRITVLVGKRDGLGIFVPSGFVYGYTKNTHTTKVHAPCTIPSLTVLQQITLFFSMLYRSNRPPFTLQGSKFTLGCIKNDVIQLHFLLADVAT